MSFEAIYGNDLNRQIVVKLFFLPTQILTSYFAAYVLAPFLTKKKFVKFLIAFVVGTYIFCVLARFAVVYGLETVLKSSQPKDSIVDILTNQGAIFGQYILQIYVTPLFFIILKYSKDAFVTKRKFELIQAEKMVTELNFLKSQVHPHFLFNTLNNIYVLILKQDIRTTETVRKLADMMEYMVASSDQSLVAIEKEIELIQNYIDLEKLRYGDRLELTFNYDPKVLGCKIAPLMLLSFVENAFKHGVSGDIDDPKVTIALKSKDSHIKFYIYNTKNVIQQSDEKSYKKGIGVSNVKRQLDLIYGKTYHLEINEMEDSYEVNLLVVKK
ncbi:MAG: histidine kinase [Saprospiraceae bacterium]|nr:histidine kinase [Saprospiraceae bacterium]